MNLRLCLCLLAFLLPAATVRARTLSERIHAIAEPNQQELVVYSWRTPEAGANLVRQGTFTAELNRHYMTPMDAGHQRYGLGFYTGITPIASQEYAHSTRHMLVEVAVPRGTRYIDLTDPAVLKRFADAGISKEDLLQRYNGPAALKITDEWVLLRNPENTQIRPFSGTRLSIPQLDRIYGQMTGNARVIFANQVAQHVTANAEAHPDSAIVKAVLGPRYLLENLRRTLQGISDSPSAEEAMQRLRDQDYLEVLNANPDLRRDLNTKIVAHLDPAKLGEFLASYTVRSAENFPALLIAGLKRLPDSATRINFVRNNMGGIDPEALFEIFLNSPAQERAVLFEPVAAAYAAKGQIANLRTRLEASALPQEERARLWRRAIPGVFGSNPFAHTQDILSFLKPGGAAAPATWQELLRACREPGCVEAGLQFLREPANLAELRIEENRAHARLVNRTLRETLAAPEFEGFNSYTAMRIASRLNVAEDETLDLLLSRALLRVSPSTGDSNITSLLIEFLRLSRNHGDGLNLERNLLDQVIGKGAPIADAHELIAAIRAPELRSRAFLHVLSQVQNQVQIIKLLALPEARAAQSAVETTLLRLLNAGITRDNADLWADILKAFPSMSESLQRRIARGVLPHLESMNANSAVEAGRIISSRITLEDFRALYPQRLSMNDIESYKAMRMLFKLGRKAWIPEFIDGAELYMRALAGAGLSGDKYRYLLLYADDHTKKLEIILAYLNSGTDRSLLPELINDLARSLNQMIARNKRLEIGDSRDQARRVLLALRPLLENEATMENAARVWDIYMQIGAAQKLSPEEGRELLQVRQGVGRVPMPWALRQIIYTVGDPGREFALRELARVPAERIVDSIDALQTEMREPERQRLRASARALATAEPQLAQTMQTIRGLILPSEPQIIFNSADKIREVLQHMEKPDEESYRNGTRLIYRELGLRDLPSGSADSPGQISLLLRWLANPGSESIIESISSRWATPAPDLYFYYSLHRQTLSLADRRILDNRLLASMHSALQSGSASAHAFAVHLSTHLNLANSETNTRLLHYLNRETRGGAILPTLAEQQKILEALKNRSGDLTREQINLLTQTPLRRLESDKVYADRIAAIRAHVSDTSEADRLVAEMDTRRQESHRVARSLTTRISGVCARAYGAISRRTSTR